MVPFHYCIQIVLNRKRCSLNIFVKLNDEWTSELECWHFVLCFYFLNILNIRFFLTTFLSLLLGSLSRSVCLSLLQGLKLTSLRPKIGPSINTQWLVFHYIPDILFSSCTFSLVNLIHVGGFSYYEIFKSDSVWLPDLCITLPTCCLWMTLALQNEYFQNPLVFFFHALHP